MQHSELASQQMACARTASQPSTALLPQRKVRSGGTDETGGIPGGSALAGFFNDVRRSPPDANPYLYLLPFPGFARRPTLPRSQRPIAAFPCVNPMEKDLYRRIFRSTASSAPPSGWNTPS